MARFSRNDPSVYWWSIDALLGPDELFEALSRFPLLAIRMDGQFSKVSPEEYVATYEKYADNLIGGEPFDKESHTRLRAQLSLDASILTGWPRPAHPALASFRYCPLLMARWFEMEYEQETNRIIGGGHGWPNPIYFGISLSHQNVWNAALAGIPASDIENLFPNVGLIEGLTEWVMKHSEPCKVMLPGRGQVLPVRLGRQARRWVNEHVGLARLGFSVRTSRPVRADPSWLPPSVLQMAHVIRDEKDYAALPVLSDALEEAGCADKAVLRHCRGRHEYVRGCWVVGMLLAS